MNPVHNNTIDLNLLKIFEAVMMELSVSRAAERLHMTQPAVSHALRRLRRITNDDLFVKAAGGVRPTRKALELWEPISNGLSEIRYALSPPDFEPVSSHRTFTLVAADYTKVLFLPLLLSKLGEAAPNVNLRFIPGSNSDAHKLLDHSEIDVAIGRFSSPSTRLLLHTLLSDRYVCVMRKKHSLAQRNLTPKRYADAAHLLVSLTGDSVGFIDKQLREMNLERRVALTVNQFSLVPELVSRSDLIASIPLRLVQQSPFVKDLTIAELPFSVAPTSLQMMWHQRVQSDPAHQWFRDLLLEISQSFPTLK